MIIKRRAYPRAGLVGNPSDGYFGKTISFCFSNYYAEVILYQSPELEIVPCELDHSRFDSIQHLSENVDKYGYYGGIRLLKATVKCFYRHCEENGVELDERNFTIRYRSDIPNRVGLAGSSAIITACFRALLAFYNLSIPEPLLANLILSVEVDELKLSAGLQDRVAQVYEGLVYMDFDRTLMDERGYGEYQRLDSSLLPSLYIAFRTDLSEGSEVFHNDIRSRFNRGEEVVVGAMRYWAELAVRMRKVLLSGESGLVANIINENFDRRKEIYKISEGNLNMIEAARATGASAKFSGSGGAIVGTYEDENMFKELEARMASLGISVLKPHVIEENDND